MRKKYFFIHPKLVEITWPEEVSEKILLEQQTWKNYLEKEMVGKIAEIRLGFNTLSIAFDQHIELSSWEMLFQNLLDIKTSATYKQSKCWKIPVCYDLEMGYDLPFVAEQNKISEEEVVHLHSSQTYLLHFYGFLPGFMYLGGLNPKLHLRRKQSPDRNIQAGSVAIGGKQTGIYPSESPGGWHVIGRSPVQIFDINRKPPVIPQISDRIKFMPITIAEFREIEKEKSNFKWEYD